MRRIALLTALFAMLLAGLAFGLPSAGAYVEGIDDGPPRSFTDVAEASRAAGYDFPTVESMPGWRIEAIMVTPVYYGHKLLEELAAEPRVRTIPSQQGRVIIKLSVAAAPPPRGVHNYIDVMYASDKGGRFTLAINRPRARRPIVAGPGQELLEKKERVQFGGRQVELVTYKTDAIEILATAWIHDGRSISETVYNLPVSSNTALTKDELLAVLGAVH